MSNGADLKLTATCWWLAGLVLAKRLSPFSRLVGLFWTAFETGNLSCS